jgi:hypothetical protein
MNNQTKSRTQIQNKSKPDNNTTTRSYKGTTNNTKTQTRVVRPRQKVIIKKYYYNGRPTYMWYDRGRYYDPFSYSSTWWLLHWAELQHQQDLMNDARYVAMKAQVEALQAQGVQPNPNYTESVPSLPTDTPITPVRGFFFYFLWMMVILICAAAVVFVLSILGAAGQ